MPYLPNIIKRIDNFYNLTQSLTRLKRMAVPQYYTMPDDPEEEEEDLSKGLPGDEWVGIYPKIISVANQLSEQADDISNELQLIAELYKKALEINGGYSQVGKAISISLANMAFKLAGCLSIYSLSSASEVARVALAGGAVARAPSVTTASGITMPRFAKIALILFSSPVTSMV